jgi:hypothetical protein
MKNVLKITLTTAWKNKEASSALVRKCLTINHQVGKIFERKKISEEP